MCKVAIVGSRNYNDYQHFKAIINCLKQSFPIDMIVSGGAAGVDLLAYQYAIEYGITFVCHPPIPNEPSPQRYHRRNLRIVNQAEIIIALPMGESRGTRHSISLAKKLNKRVFVFEMF